MRYDKDLGAAGNLCTFWTRRQRRRWNSGQADRGPAGRRMGGRCGRTNDPWNLLRLSWNLLCLFVQRDPAEYVWTGQACISMKLAGRELVR